MTAEGGRWTVGGRRRTDDRSLDRREAIPASRSLRRQLESSRYDPGNREVFVQLLPPQRVTIELDPYLCQLFVRRPRKDSKPVGRKTDDASVVKFYVNRSLLDPSAESDRLD
jgi:hypothetical protein